MTCILYETLYSYRSCYLIKCERIIPRQLFAMSGVYLIHMLNTQWYQTGSKASVLESEINNLCIADLTGWGMTSLSFLFKSLPLGTLRFASEVCSGSSFDVSSNWESSTCSSADLSETSCRLDVIASCSSEITSKVETNLSAREMIESVWPISVCKQLWLQRISLVKFDKKLT